MLQFGYNTGVINAPEVVRSFIFFFKQIRLQYIKISTTKQIFNWIVSFKWFENNSPFLMQLYLSNTMIYSSFQNIENFMKDVYKDRYGEDISDDYVKRLYSVAVSIFAIGGMLGGFSGGIIANRFGRFVRKCFHSICK